MSDSVLATSPDTASTTTCEDLLKEADIQVDLAACFKKSNGVTACTEVAMRCRDTTVIRSWLYLWILQRVEVPTAQYVYFFPEKFNGKRYGILKQEGGALSAGIVETSAPPPRMHMKGYEKDIFVALLPHGTGQPAEFVEYVRKQFCEMPQRALA